MGERLWTHGCDACDADEPVQYIPPIGYLCERCRQPDELRRLWKDVYGEELGG